MSVPEAMVKPAGSKPSPTSPRPWRRWVFLAAVLLALLVGWISPDLKSLLFLGGALFALGLLLFLQRLASISGPPQLRVRPGIVVMMTTITLVLALGEISLRLFLFQSFPDWEPLSRAHEGLGYQHDRTLGWFPVPNSRRTFWRNGRRISAAHNSMGFRDPEPVFDSRPGIMFIGDSFLWGYNVAAEDCFTAKLRARHPEWRIYNCGVVGYGTDQEYLLLQKFFPKFEPRVVFLVFCVENDHLDNQSNGGGMAIFKPYFSVESNGLKLHGVPVPLPDWVFCGRYPFLSRSYLLRLTMRAWGNIRSPQPHLVKDPTTALLGAIRRYVSKHGAAFGVGLTGKDAEVEQFLERSKTPWVDLSTDLRGKGDFHWGPEGHTFVAGKVEQFLLSTDWAEPASGAPGDLPKSIYSAPGSE